MAADECTDPLSAWGHHGLADHQANRVVRALVGALEGETDQQAREAIVNALAEYVVADLAPGHGSLGQTHGARRLNTRSRRDPRDRAEAITTPCHPASMRSHSPVRRLALLTGGTLGVTVALGLIREPPCSLLQVVCPTRLLGEEHVSVPRKHFKSVTERHRMHTQSVPSVHRESWPDAPATLETT